MWGCDTNPLWMCQNNLACSNKNIYLPPTANYITPDCRRKERSRNSWKVKSNKSGRRSVAFHLSSAHWLIFCHCRASSGGAFHGVLLLMMRSHPSTDIRLVLLSASRVSPDHGPENLLTFAKIDQMASGGVCTPLLDCMHNTHINNIKGHVN